MKKITLWLIIACLLYVVPSQISTEKDCEIRIKIANSDIEMPLDQYIVGVISAEIYPHFHFEAIKAQAIAVRTYALHTTNFGTKPIEPTTTHQAFVSEEMRRNKWQQSYAKYEQKMQQAVEETSDEVLTYNGELITAMFHASSNGQIESAKNYSGNDIPYLQSVTSAETETSDVNYSYDELNERLQINWTAKNYKALQISRNSSGRVAYVEGNGRRWSGREFRQLLQLKSTAFQWNADQHGMTFRVFGYGHGVGMSQQGANLLAQQGKNYIAILVHYYKGANVQKIDRTSCLKSP